MNSITTSRSAPQVLCHLYILMVFLDQPNIGVGISSGLDRITLIGYGLGGGHYIYHPFSVTDAYYFPPGIMRAFLVYPTYIVFPNLLPTVQSFDALHRGKKIFSQKQRVSISWSNFIAIFVSECFPEFIVPWVLGFENDWTIWFFLKSHTVLGL